MQHIRTGCKSASRIQLNHDKEQQKRVYLFVRLSINLFVYLPNCVSFFTGKRAYVLLGPSAEQKQNLNILIQDKPVIIARD
jgi:hypothetical protein